MNKNRFVLLYDCPLETCDKIWLYNGLRKYGEVRIVSTLTKKSYFQISRFAPRLKIGKMIRVVLICIQSIRSIFISNKNDIVVVWARDQGCILYAIYRLFLVKRKIVSFNWLKVPDKQERMIENIFNNSDFLPIINNKALEKSFIEHFKLKSWNGIFLPDVFDDKQVFHEIEYRKNGYVFAGGVNNRDWNTLIKSAEKTPDIKYIIVGNKGDIRNPNLKNVIVKENLSAEEYYSLMKKAFITICPLKENRTSGLINILKSSQFGIPCISTKLGVTDMYYSQSNKDKLLFKMGDNKDLKNKIVKIYDMDKSDYEKTARDFQDYIKDNFDPEKNIEKLMLELKKRGWVEKEAGATS